VETISCYLCRIAPRVPEPQLSAWRGVLNAHASVVARIERALADAGLPPLSWYDVLWALRSAPGRRARMGELAASLTISRGGLTKLADRLEDMGLLQREPAEQDGRGYYATLTDAGNQLLRRMWPIYSGVLRDTLVAAVTEEEAALIAAALQRVAEAAEHR
jgi:DNA-binding MarR family transcriptional regulator